MLNIPIKVDENLEIEVITYLIASTYCVKVYRK